MEKIKNLSLRKTIVLYLLVNLVCSYFLSYFIVSYAERLQRRIWETYESEEYWEKIEQGRAANDLGLIPTPTRPYDERMSRSDAALSETCDFLQTYSVLVLASLGTVLSVWLFYRNKLQIPLCELGRASERVSEGDLDFSVSYNNKDEMGRLCREFERMRMQLAQNNRRMWKLYEQEKALRAGIAHDIRSPLAVLKGYQEMLLDAASDGMCDGEAFLEMLLEQTAQIGRMEEFLDLMQRLSSLEQREIVRRPVQLSAFAARLEKQTDILAKKAGKMCVVFLDAERETVLADEGIVMEVLENLLANALRYAVERVTVTLRTARDALEIEVADDGAGFLEDADVLTQARYHANPQDDLTHFGMGLYICRLYCERHGGRLLLGNGAGKGARAVAVFGEI